MENATGELLVLWRFESVEPQSADRSFASLKSSFCRVGDGPLLKPPSPMIMMRRPEGGGNAPTQFVPGDLVQHRRYGYRGVVVAVDNECLASDAWYHGNQTQPARDKPWYHVLVDGSGHTTYAAQDNLERAETAEPVQHPLVSVFFESFLGGVYQRNDREWNAPQ